MRLRGIYVISAPMCGSSGCGLRRFVDVLGDSCGWIYLLDKQVMEAEAVRHGQKAATVTGLMNESTGDTVDMDVPAER